MSGRLWLLALLALVVLMAVAGCGGSDAGLNPAVTASVSASATPTPAPSSTPTTAGGKALAALQAAVADLGAVSVSGGAPGGGKVGLIHGVADLGTGSFRTSIALENGSGELQMIRLLDRTWTKAPPGFWTGVGYTRKDALAVRGKWVGERADNIKALVASLDPAATIRSLLALRQDDVVRLEPVRSGRYRGARVLEFGTGGQRQRVVFSRGAKPRLLRISSTRDGSTTVLDYRVLPKVQVDLPRSRDVYLPSS